MTNPSGPFGRHRRCTCDNARSGNISRDLCPAVAPPGGVDSGRARSAQWMRRPAKGTFHVETQNRRNPRAGRDRSHSG
jgi:hypothetical protein